MKAIVISMLLILAGIEQNSGPLTKRSPTQPQIPQSFHQDTSTPNSQLKRHRPNSSPDLTSPTPDNLNTTPSLSSITNLEILSKLDFLVSQSKTNQEQINLRFDQVDLNFKLLESKYEMLAGELNILKPKLDDFEKILQDQKSYISQLNNKIDDIENRTRRDNLIFKGISKLTIRESWSDCKARLLSILSKYLDISDITIERAHRLGKQQAIIAKIPNSDSIKKYFM